jgi:hypothetical protein
MNPLSVSINDPSRGGASQASFLFCDGSDGAGEQSDLRQASEEVRWRSTDELRLHPSISLRKIEPREEAVRSASQLGTSVWEIPVPVTESGLIIHREEIWTLAQRRKRKFIKCLVFRLDQRQVLRQIIINNRESFLLNKFVRVELALEAVPSSSALAQEHLRRGGRRNLLSKLAKDERVDRRQMVAQLAGVGRGTVPKVEAILNHAIPEVLHAARQDRLKLEAAFRVSKVAPQEQFHLLNSPAKSSSRRRIMKLVAAHRADLSPTQQSLNEMDAVLQKLEPSSGAADLCSRIRAILEEWKERIRTTEAEHETSYPTDPS